MSLLSLLLASFASLTGCDRWSAGDLPHEVRFQLECNHASTACESCHPANQPIGKVDNQCIACHLEVRPPSHDPATTGQCSECHSGSCGWDSASPHPAGFSDPLAHGLETNLGAPNEGNCTECHGADLRGGVARGCDDCHATEGHAEWRTECTFCHGGTVDQSGAPPQDIDNTDNPADITFRAHTAHVNADGDYRELACHECHGDYTDVLAAGHMLDATAGRAEVGFTLGIAKATVWDGVNSCANNYCHGSGLRPDGTATDDGKALDCESCHRTNAQGWRQMSGLHEAHLANDNTITCNDCHAAVMDRAGNVVTPSRHVDGARDIAFFEPAIRSTDGGGSCVGVCHGVDHDTFGWGHAPGYDAPEVHGQDANLQISNCTACHGANYQGGIGQGCDDCHASEGNPGWRTDCTYCHGGANGDRDGVPPQDINNVTGEANISFDAHPEHNGLSPIGHKPYGCVECHVVPDNVLSPGHTIDNSPGKGEVTLEGGTSYEASYDVASKTCSNLYCHGDGIIASGHIQDSDTALTCDSCHMATGNYDRLSGTHATHLGVNGVTCADCHSPVVDSALDIVTPDRHVDRTIDLDPAGSGWSVASQSCTITCHNTNHDGWGWGTPHPAGYDAPELHGQEALQRAQVCNTCHGANFNGASAVGCNDCHTDAGRPNWRSDCTFCHGGTGGDTVGLPPQDIDNVNNEDQISFKAHPEHSDGDIHPLWTCGTCHQGADAYTDATTDLNHWFDTTARVAEVRFTGIAAGTVYAAGNCSNNVCHGNGQVNGSSLDGTQALSCDGCHGYTQNRNTMSGTHALHLNVSGVSCADCHSATVNAAGSVTTASRHVNAVVNVDNNATVGWNAAASTCTNGCHSHTHTNISWEGGHAPGYDDPLIHGQDALFVVSDCATSGCHGTNLSGGASGQGCDSCHTPNWRSDCAFCHGTPGSDGMPPEDLDNVTNEASITFMAHPEHGDGDTHPLWGCEECHGTASLSYTDAFLDTNHWFDSTPGIAEVSFGGLGSGGSYASNTSTCSEVYCHSTGYYDTALGDFYYRGTVSDSNNGLGCGDCHLAPPDSTTGTEEHRKHKHNQVSCDWCHDSVASSSTAIKNGDLHVDGLYQVVYSSSANQWGGMSYNAGTMRCDGECHAGGDDKDHSNKLWK